MRLLTDDCLCKCGHKRKVHRETTSINYTGGSCNHCDCLNYITAEGQDQKYIKKLDKKLFATLEWRSKMAQDSQFLKNLSKWILKYTSNVNVSQRLAILANKIVDEG